MFFMMSTSEAFHELIDHEGFTENFQALLKQKLWMGLCGRCGVIGHIASECPLLQTQKSGIPGLRFLSQRQSPNRSNENALI